MPLYNCETVSAIGDAKALVEYEPQMQDLSELFLNLDRGQGYISPIQVLDLRKTIAAERAEAKLEQYEDDEFQRRATAITANQAQADLNVSSARQKLNVIKREVVAAHEPLTIPQQVVGAAIELTPVFTQGVKHVVRSTLQKVADRAEYLEGQGRERVYTAQYEKEPIVLDSNRVKAVLTATATIASLLHGAQVGEGASGNITAQHNNIVATSIFGSEHRDSKVTLAPLIKLESSTTVQASPAHLAAQQHPGSDSKPVTNDQARKALIRQGYTYAHKIMGDVMNHASQQPKFADKLLNPANNNVIKTVSGFFDHAFLVSVNNPTSVTPKKITEASQLYANGVGALHHPELFVVPSLNSDPAIKALSDKLFSGDDSYTIEEQAAVSGAILSAAETLMSPEDYATYLQSLADDSAAALPTPTAQPTPAEQVPAAAGETPHLNTEHYHGMAWTPEDFAKIQANMSVYQEAATAYDLPWEMIAVLHKREHNLAVSNPGNGQGIYQFFNEAGQYTPGPVSTAEFLRQTKLVAQRLRTDYANRGMQDVALNAESVDAQKLMDTFGRYNGRAALYVQQAKDAGYSTRQWFMGSPYVVNLISDAQNSDKNPDWKQYLADGSHVGRANHQVGAFVAFKELAEIAGDGNKLVNQIQLLPQPVKVHHVSQAEHEAGLQMPEKLADNTVYFSQHNGPWANDKYALPGHNQTISDSGCAPTSEAIIISTLTGTKVTPDVLAQWNLDHGFRTANSGTDHTSFTAFGDAYGLQSADISGDQTKILDTLRAGGMVIMNAQDRDPNTPGTGGGHVLVMRGLTADGKVLIADPNSIEFSNQTWDLSQLLATSTSQVAVTK